MHKAANALAIDIILKLVERDPTIIKMTNGAGKTPLEQLVNKGKLAGQQKKVEACIEQVNQIIAKSDNPEAKLIQVDPDSQKAKL